MYRRGGIILAVLALACDPPSPPAPVETPTPEPAPSEEADWRDLVEAADRRELSETLVSATRGSDPERRRQAMTAVARLHDPGDASLAVLRAGLRDTDPGVRAAASLGFGAFGTDAPSATDGVLAGALAAEADPAVRVALLRDLGRLASDRALEVVVSELRADEPASRAAACLAIAERGIALRPVSREIRARMAARLDPAQPEDVRFACAYALARVPPMPGTDELRGEAVALGLSVGDESPRVRLQAYRALARIPGVDIEVIAHGTEDEDWQVRVQAFRALGSIVASRDNGPQVLTRALRAAFEALIGDGVVYPGGPLHTFFAGLDAARGVATSGPIHDLATELHATLGSVPSARDQGIAHCAAAELVDRSRGWPSRVTECGGDAVQAWERAVLEAGVLADLDGAEPQRLVRLRRLLEDEHPAVREAVLAAAAHIVHVEANDLILNGMAIDDAGVRAAALEALQTIAGRRPTEAVVPPPLPADRTRDALRSLREATPDAEHETLVTWVGAVEATGVRELTDEVRALARHENRGVRDRARALLRVWGIEAPSDHAAIPNPIDAAALAEPTAPRPRVRVETTRGEIVIELRPDEAPTTVARFLELVDEGTFDGLTFHRIVSAFVVQGGDPRGDGYGGPGWAQRCEDNRLPYERGTVGMALAGRDTSGSQFFITHGPQPHLEGRYTAFGQVVEGMERVDQLQRGDRMTAVSRVGSP